MTSTNRIIIFDTTLRDGEQSPGATMNTEEKLLVAEALDQMGVDIIEAGFAIASQGDSGSIQQISKRVKNAVICSLARALKGDIDAAGASLAHAKRKRIHTFISTSPLHMEYKLKMKPDDVISAITESVTHARKYTDDVEWSAEDATRTEPDFLCRAVETAIKAGATTINIPDTVGYAIPEEYAARIRMLLNRVPNMDKAIISTHCHNDLGLAVANSIAAVHAGARQVECTINGLGERAGNAALEEIVMALKTRNDFLPYTTGIKTEHITRISRLVSQVTSFIVQNNKAIVGANAFAHESGIHQHGMLANSQTYEIMTPESVGLTESTLVMGKHSGRAAFKNKLEELEISVPDDEALNKAFEQFKALADKKKEIFDEDILALVQPRSGGGERVQLTGLHLTCGTAGPQEAKLSLTVDGVRKDTTASGNGPVDAIFNGIKALVPHEARLHLYQVHSVTHGTDAQAEVTVRLAKTLGGDEPTKGKEGRVREKMFNGHAADPDTMVATTKAYLHALNYLLDHQTRAAKGDNYSYSDLQKSRI